MSFLCHSDAIPEAQSRGFEIDGAAVFAVRKQGLLFVYRNECPHLKIGLEWMPDQFLDTDGCLIQCSMHGALFLIENGHCISGPCQGQKLTPIKHTEQNGEIRIHW